jgi:hypothetical protein
MNRPKKLEKELNQEIIKNIVRCFVVREKYCEDKRTGCVRGGH